MKLHGVPVIIALLMVVSTTQADPIDKVAALVRQANIEELSKLFASNVEVTILDNENMYSKTQAALILDKFFTENKPRAVKMLHKINSNPNYQYGVLILNCDKATYRVTYTLKQTNGSLLLIEFRVEEEKG